MINVVFQLKDLLQITQDGKFAYVWGAKLDDGTEVKQFEDSVFQDIMTNPNCNVESLEAVRVSVDKLDVRKVKEFFLLPTAVAKKVCPEMQPFRMVINLAAGEKFISYWLTDVYKSVGRIYRHVLGISKPVNGAQAKFFVVINPNGRVTIATDDNQSYDGE